MKKKSSIVKNWELLQEKQFESFIQRFSGNKTVLLLWCIFGNFCIFGFFLHFYFFLKTTVVDCSWIIKFLRVPSILSSQQLQKKTKPAIPVKIMLSKTQHKTLSQLSKAHDKQKVVQE